MLIVVIFNLKPGAAPDSYEQWAKATDIPTVRTLGSVKDFSVLRVTGLLGSEEPPPYAYIELLEVTDLEALGGDIASETMQRVAAEFADFAEATFMLTEPL